MTREEGKRSMKSGIAIYDIGAFEIISKIIKFRVAENIKLSRSKIKRKSNSNKSTDLIDGNK